MTTDFFAAALPRTLTTSFGPVRYRDLGHGPPVVFVHGFLASGELWRETANRLAATHRCIVADWPLGSHEVPLSRGADVSLGGVARLVAEVIDALDLHAVTLVGNDSGGVLCQLVAADHPARIGRLVLTPCDGFEIMPPPGFGYLRWLPFVPGLLFVLARAMLHVAPLRRVSSTYGALTRRPPPAALLRRFVEPAARNRGVRRDVSRLLRSVTPAVTLAVAERLPAFGRPALLVWNDDERFFPISLAHRLAAALGGARVEIIPDAGVFLPLDRPDALATAIGEFTAEQASPATVPLVRAAPVR